MHYAATKLVRGYANRLLFIDLSDGAITMPSIEPAVRDYFLGGRGLGLYLLHQATTPATRPGDPANPLILANGPLGGIPQFPGTAKAMAVSLSPLTGIPGVSNFGGYFGAYLKFAGFDALEVHVGHGYLLSQFLSPYNNRRRDGYGGSIENRSRFPREIACAVRAAIGDRAALWIKLNMEDGFGGGLTYAGQVVRCP